MMNRLGIYQRDGKWIEPEKVVGIVNDDKSPMPFSQKWDSPCTDFRHNPPMGLYVAPGEVYVHECPNCGATRTIVGDNITFNTPDKFINVPNFCFNEEDDEDAFAAESDDEILDKMGR